MCCLRRHYFFTETTVGPDSLPTSCQIFPELQAASLPRFVQRPWFVSLQGHRHTTWSIDCFRCTSLEIYSTSRVASLYPLWVACISNRLTLCSLACFERFAYRWVLSDSLITFSCRTFPFASFSMLILNPCRLIAPRQTSWTLFSTLRQVMSLVPSHLPYLW